MSEPNTKQTDQSEAREINPVLCKECGGWPTLGWLDKQLVLGCECGFRLVPEDALLDHSHMPASVEWEVADGE